MLRIYHRLVTKLFVSILPDILYPLNTKEVEYLNDWLINAHDSGRLRTYFLTRDYALMKQLGSGVDRETYNILIGRRAELLHFVATAKSRFDKKTCEKLKRVQ